MSNLHTTVQLGRVSRIIWIGGSAVAALLIVATAFGVARAIRPGPVAASERGLEVLPRVISFKDRVFREGESVKARYRVVNTLNRPTTIEEVRTSCSCMATVAEEGRKFPLVLAPKGSIDITISTSAMSSGGVDQSYTAVIMASVDGLKAREYPISMQFTVADILRSEPTSIQVHEAPTDAPLRSSLVLFTYRDPREIAEPKVRVLGTERIRAVVRRSPTKSDHDRKTLPRFVVDLTVDPGEAGDPVRGEIEVETAGEPTITVPVTFVFKRDISFQPGIALAVGRAGTRVDCDIFQEFKTDVWRDPEVVSKPSRCDVRITRFDTHTNRISLTIPVATGGEDEFVELRSSDQSRTVRLPIRLQVE